MAPLSSYAADGLSEQAKWRYEEKIQLVGSLDSFLLPTTRSLASPVEDSDIVAYLVLQTSSRPINRWRLIISSLMAG